MPFFWYPRECLPVIVRDSVRNYIRIPLSLSFYANVIGTPACLYMYICIIYTHIHILDKLFVWGHTKINNWERPVMTIHRVERNRALMYAIHEKGEKYRLHPSKIAGTSWKVYRCYKRRNDSLNYMEIVLLQQPTTVANGSTDCIWNLCQNIKT